MSKIFISHSSKDLRFTRLLAALLDYHGLTPWFSDTSLRGGDHFGREIQTALDEAEVLLAVISSHSVRSRWVTKEIVAFRAGKPDAPLVPLRLDAVASDDLLEEVRELHWIDFTEDMLSGFRDLMELFGLPFLPEHSFPVANRRKLDRRRLERREGDRRGGEDRRTSRLDRRLRVGCWKGFAEATGIGKFDEITLDYRMRLKTIDALRGEVNGYVFRDAQGTALDPEDLLERVAIQIWDEMRERRYLRAVHMVEGIADELYRDYRVEIVDRRAEGDRRETERREGDRRSG